MYREYCEWCSGVWHASLVEHNISPRLDPGTNSSIKTISFFSHEAYRAPKPGRQMLTLLRNCVCMLLEHNSKSRNASLTLPTNAPLEPLVSSSSTVANDSRSTLYVTKRPRRTLLLSSRNRPSWSSCSILLIVPDDACTYGTHGTPSYAPHDNSRTT